MFDVSILFHSKVIEEKPFGGLADPPPPLSKGRVKVEAFVSTNVNSPPIVIP